MIIHVEHSARGTLREPCAAVEHLMRLLRTSNIQPLLDHASKATSSIAQIFSRSAKNLRLVDYHRVYSKKEYYQRRQEWYQLLFERIGDLVLKVFVELVSKDPVLTEFVKSLPSVAHQSKHSDKKVEKFIKSIVLECESASIQAILFDLFQISNFVDVPAKGILLENAKKCKSMKKEDHNCFKSDAIETIVGFFSCLQVNGNIARAESLQFELMVLRQQRDSKGGVLSDPSNHLNDIDAFVDSILTAVSSCIAEDNSFNAMMRDIAFVLTSFVCCCIDARAVPQQGFW